MLRSSPKLLDFIRRSEAPGGVPVLHAYLDPNGIPTIGFGHTDGVRMGMTISAQLAEALLIEDVSSVEFELTPMVQALTLTQGMWDALVDLTFNMAGGPRALPRKAPKLFSYLCNGDKEAAANEFLDIDHDAKGDVLPGLAARRKADAAMFLS